MKEWYRFPEVKGFAEAILVSAPNKTLRQRHVARDKDVKNESELDSALNEFENGC